MSYYIAVGADRRGPLEKDQLLANGLRPETLVWTEGMTDWVPAHTVADLSDLFAQAQPAQSQYNPPGQGQPAYPGAGESIGYQAAPAFSQSEVNGKKIAAGICGIILGGLGIHKFILGFPVPGIIMIICSFVLPIATCGFGAPLALAASIIGIIEGIIYLTKSDEQFYRDYIVNRKQWF